ncbi:muconolactone Delta-isomerase [Georgenia daeguensis]|uniref:Muconolactone Delta-isomerase n=1 Tax=Georgenia daeguensis TaxID=908355 RepID=A0ABP8ERD1_9MICO
MLYLVHMVVDIPETVPADVAQETIAREKAYSQELQRGGEWAEIWRVVGEYANYSIFDVENHDRLHEILSGLPLYRWMTIKVTPLAKHGSSIR